ncbi:DUF1146 family protein [Pseudogracilibacillus sp. SE30717A]|uniref:DUF1146 family protein n=1 Tax=Pseudogracilibacillus sp. SE30717A TaxID=3098293 RepID=UPI00300DE67E
MEVGDKMISIGYFSIIGMLSHIIFIYITWTAMQGINVEAFVRANKVTEARIILVFVSIVIGTGVSRFVLDIIQWSQDLIYLF